MKVLVNAQVHCIGNTLIINQLNKHSYPKLCANLTVRASIIHKHLLILTEISSVIWAKSNVKKIFVDAICIGEVKRKMNV